MSKKKRVVPVKYKKRRPKKSKRTKKKEEKDWVDKWLVFFNYFKGKV